MPAAMTVIAVVAGLMRSPSPATARLRMLQPPVAGLALQRLAAPPRAGLAAPPRAGVALVAGAIGGAAVLGAWAWLGYGVTAPLLPAIAGAVAGATGAATLNRLGADRARRNADAALTEAVGSLAADLRAGQQPVEALATVADSAARHRAVAAVWCVSEHSGAQAASVLDRVEHDLRTRQDQRREVAAILAGPRSTGILLAVLPLLGIGLGAGMGAHPLTVLLGEPRGQVALAVGVALETLGVRWTTRIIASAESSR